MKKKPFKNLVLASMLIIDKAEKSEKHSKTSPSSLSGLASAMPDHGGKFCIRGYTGGLPK